MLRLTQLLCRNEKLTFSSIVTVWLFKYTGRLMSGRRLRPLS